MKYAFRCKNCGWLEHADHAAECDHPHACRVCGHGVTFDRRTGLKKADPANWEALSEASPERLAELGVEAEHVVAHTAWEKPEVPYTLDDASRQPIHHDRTADETVGAQNDTE